MSKEKEKPTSPVEKYRKEIGSELIKKQIEKKEREFGMGKEEWEELQKIIEYDFEEKSKYLAKRLCKQNKKKIKNSEFSPYENLSESDFLVVKNDLGFEPKKSDDKKMDRRIEVASTILKDLSYMEEGMAPLVDTKTMTLHYIENKIKPELDKKIKKEKDKEKIKKLEEKSDKLFNLSEKLAKDVFGEKVEEGLSKKTKEKIKDREGYIEEEYTKLHKEFIVFSELIKNSPLNYKFKEDKGWYEDNNGDTITITSKEIVWNQEQKPPIIEKSPYDMVEKLRNEYNINISHIKPIEDRINQKPESEDEVKKRIEIYSGILEESAGDLSNLDLDGLKNKKEELEKKIEKTLKNELRKDWDNENKKKSLKIRKDLEKRIGELAESPEQVKGGIKNYYYRLREGVNLKETYTKTGLTEQYEDLRKKGVNPIAFLSNMFSFDLVEKINDMSDASKRKETVKDVFVNYGISIDDDSLENIIKKMRKIEIGEDWSKKAKKARKKKEKARSGANPLFYYFWYKFFEDVLEDIFE